MTSRSVWLIKEIHYIILQKNKGTTVIALMRINGLKSDVIKIGQKL